MGRLAGKRALMTGAGGLLGGDLARGFAAEGADVVLTTRTASKLEPLAEEIRAMGRRAACVGCDFTDDSAIDRLAEEAWAALGHDGLIADAGDGDVRIRPVIDEPEIVVIELSSPSGHAMFEASAQELAEFLDRTYDVVMPGNENLWVNVDDALTHLIVNDLG